MQSRCTQMAASRGKRSAQSSVVRRAIMTTRRRVASTQLPRLFLHEGFYKGHMRTGVSSSRRRYFFSSDSVRDPRSLHTSSPLLSQALLTCLQDDEDEDEYVAQIAKSHLSEILNDDVYEISMEDSSWPSLDDELGETSIWDAPLDDETAVAERRELAQRQQAPKRSAIEMLQSFDPQSPPQTDDLEEIELWLECEAQRESVLRYQKVIDSARDRRDYASLTVVQKQIVQWYPKLKEAIEEEQQAYIAKSKAKRDMNRYGPFLCSLQPQKLAVIVSHESIMHTLQRGGNGVTLVSLALRIGGAVEAEVKVQRALQQRLEESSLRNKEPELNTQDLLDENECSEIAADTSEIAVQFSEGEGEDASTSSFGSWMYGPSHLQQFIDEAHSLDPSKKTRIRINYAKRRAQWILKSDEEWTKPDKLKLGILLIEVLLETATIQHKGRQEKAFSHEKRYFPKQKCVGKIFLHDALYKTVTEHTFESLEGHTTRYKPMIIPPRDWVAPNDGGYSWLKTDLMRTHGSKMQTEALNQADLSTVFDGLNVLGSVPWAINNFVLDVAQRCWRDNIPLGDVPSRTDHILPQKPILPKRDKQNLDPDSPAFKAAKAEFRAFKEALSRYHRIKQKNMDLQSLRCSVMLKLDQAEKFKEFKQIYFPYNIDFRGRAYPVPPHLSNVGSDLCRGMLRFAEAKPLGSRGLYWLKVHLANLAGNDKLTFHGRAAFTEENMENVRAAASDPFGPNRWWMTLDDPFQGLATCQEIVNAIDSGDPESYMCSLPVHMDGSCNGLQHYAALGRDTVGGKAVNLCDADTPQDVYIGVMHEVIRRVAEEAAADLDFEGVDPDELSAPEREALKHNRAAKLVNGLIDRGVVKRTVMTSVYGVTYIGARKQIQEKIEEKLEEKGYDIDEMESEIHVACGYLASTTMDVMGELFQGARQTMTWLATCARLIAQLDQPVAWMSPIGVPVVQPYRQSKPFTILTLLQSVVLVDTSDDLPLHKSRQATAFPPNYVHSLDSSHMLLTALEMDRRGLTFSAVHDSFWTHACDIDEMNEALRDVFVELYEQPLLETLKKTWELRYPSITFPDLPERGDLDLKEVQSAPYFFQ